MGGVSDVLHQVWAWSRLAVTDPEKFGHNLTQITHPKLFEERLLDLLTASPLNVAISEDERSRPALNVLQPVLSPQNMTGGPNTIVTMAALVAALGVHVRILTTKQHGRYDSRWFWDHVQKLSGQPVDQSLLEVSPAHDACRPAMIGRNDIFLATHWTTAQQANALLPRMRNQFFFYLIQDYEPGFYPWSSNYALAVETYGMNHISIINQKFLRDYLVAQGVGKFADPAFRDDVLTFEPPIDRSLFKARSRPPGRKKRVLVYTRPSNFRNMLGLCVLALRAVVQAAPFDLASWEFIGIGGHGSVPTIDLGSNTVLTQTPWHSYQSYADYLSESEVLLCLMLSPHTSYPVLEMAASGGLVVTSTFHVKTASELRRVSANIIAVEPNVNAVVEGLLQAIKMIEDGFQPQSDISTPETWQESLSQVMPAIAEVFNRVSCSARE